MELADFRLDKKKSPQLLEIEFRILLKCTMFGK